MKVFQLPKDNRKIAELYDEIVLVLGFFDGVHVGHRKVIKQGIEIAREKNIPVAVMTFNRHPGFVFSKFHPDKIKYLTTNKQKQRHMADLGVDLYLNLEFTSTIGALRPEEFIRDYIVNLNASTVVAGFDYTFGIPKVANMSLMEELSTGRFEVVTVSEEKTPTDDEISSTRIRQLLKEGNVNEANKILGYSYETPGFVIHGKARGRHLGYPTANVYPDPHSLIPKIGVYATRIFVNGEWHDSMTSIGYNVTFGDNDSYTIEVHIFDYDKQIYGEDVIIKWEKYLRPEEKFMSIEELVERLNMDEDLTRHYFRPRINDCYSS